VSQSAPSTLPTQRRSIRILTLLGLILTAQFFDLVNTVINGPGSLYLAGAVALLFLAAFLALRARIRHQLRDNAARVDQWVDPAARSAAIARDGTAWLRGANITLLSLTILLMGIWFSHNFRPCSWLDLARRFDGCVASFHHIDTVTTLDISSDGRYLAARSLAGNVSLWRMDDRQLLRRRAEGIVVGPTLAFSPDGQLLAAGMLDGTVQLSDVSSGAVTATLGSAAAPINGVSFSADGQLLAASAWDKTVRVWQVRDGALLHTFSGLSEAVHSVAFSPDGQLLAAGDNRAIWIWSLASGQLHVRLETDSLTESVQFSPDGQLLAAGGWRGGVGLWRTADGSFIKSLDSESGQISSVAFSPDGSLLAASCQSQVAASEIEVWRVSDSAQVRTIAPRAVVEEIAWTPDGAQLAVASLREVELWTMR
jgi:WD40 repeat protein